MNTSETGVGAIEADRVANAASSAALGTPRKIEGIYAPPPMHWVGDGFRVAGYMSVIPDAMRKLSPFLMLDYHPPYDYAPSERPRGVGVHPHRGFETVTIAWEGSVTHHDSAGGGGVIGPGDVQWMTAASGILHKEYHEEAFSKRGGTFHMAQLWVNLPKAHKMDAPRYQPLLASDMGIVNTPDGLGKVRIIAGEYEGVKGPAKTYTKLAMLDIELEPKGRATFRIPAKENAALVVMKGAVRLNDADDAKESDFVLFKNEGDELVVEAKAKAHLLLLTGEPIHEPVVSYGPFVMNTKAEIVQAFQDFESGKYGHLE